MRRFLPLLAIPLLILGMAHSTHAQVTPGPANQAGLLYASNFSSWTVPQGNVGPYSWSNPQQCTVTSGGISFKAFTVGTPVTLVDTVNSAHTEVVTPTAVNVSGAGCSITINPIYSHNSFFFTTSTGGLQEAINWAGQQLYSVILTPDWIRAGGVTADITAATGNANVSILDQRNSCLIAYAWSGSAYAEQANFCTGNPLTLQHNSTNVTDQTLFNALDNGTISPDAGYTLATWLTNSTGGWAAEVPNLSGQFQMYPVAPVAGQNVVVYPSSHTLTFVGVTTGYADNNSASLGINFAGTGTNTATAIWSFTLPAGIDPSTVTAIYPFIFASANGVNSFQTAYCGEFGETVDGFPSPGNTADFSTQQFTSTASVGTDITKLTCTALVGGSIPANKVASVDVYGLGAFVYYTGTPVTSPTFLNVIPPLRYNPVLGMLSIDTTSGFAGSYLMPWTVATLPNTNGTGPFPVVNALYLVDDGAWVADCTTGGGTNLVECYWNGTTWTAFGTPTQTTVTGTTAGTAVWSQPQQFSTWKQATIYLNGYENTTATAQTITLPASFAAVGYVITDGGTSCANVTVSGATVTLPVSMGAPQTSLCEVRGY